MKNRKAEAVKKRIAERKRVILQNKKWQPEQEIFENNDLPLIETTENSNSNDSFQQEPNKSIGQNTHTFSDWFLFRLLVSMCFVLIVAIMFRSTNPSLDSYKTFLKNSMKRDYQFAKISNWTSKTMGDMFSFSPIEFFKSSEGLRKNSDVIPVSGKVVESFKKNGKGITVETERDKDVTSIQDGIVIFAGIDKNHGKTIIVQQSDQMNVWYGNLGSIKVNLYQHVSSGESLGKVLNKSTSNRGEYYFAIEKDDKFFDPSKVISFE
ncbi:MAG: peptidase [Bacillales bacterium]|nr:peptidase [Bacillales bacterium]